MRTFWEWLQYIIAEAGKPIIEPGVLAGYEGAFKDELRKVISRTENPDLRARLIEMLDCPIRGRRGQCLSFTDYIVSALLRNGIQHRYDLEAALGYVGESLGPVHLAPRSGPRASAGPPCGPSPTLTLGRVPEHGRFRRRWLEYPPSNLGSGHRNRVGEALARMVEDSSLRATQTGAGARV
jgi:hypothetical protein